jgi:DNA primase
MIKTFIRYASSIGNHKKGMKVSIVEIYEKEIKPRIDYLKELSDLEPVKKEGGRYLLICPNCRQKEAFIYGNTGIIECNRKNNCGHKLDFLAYQNNGVYPRGEDYIKAIKNLGKTCGVEVEGEASEKHTKQYQSRKSDQQILLKIWNYFQSLLANSKGAKYLKSRSFPVDKDFFGMYPKVEEFKRWITENNLDLDRCKNLGLIRNDFEGRLIGVWKIKDGEICNFWARSLDDKDKKSKYSRLANHSDLKQEYPHGSENIKGDRSIWVEGHLDVIAAHLSALDDVVGCGTASVSDKALQALKTSEVILCLDNDQAGQDGMYNFIKKHRNDDLKIFVAKIPHEDCKDLADVYEKHGKVAVHEIFEEKNLIHGMTFAAEYILDKNKGENEWSPITITSAMEEAKNFDKRVLSKHSWKTQKFFWPVIQNALDLQEEHVEAIEKSIHDKQVQEEKAKITREKLKEIHGALDQNDSTKIQEALQDWQQELTSISCSASDLQDILTPSSEQDIIDEMQEVSDSIYTGYAINDDVKIEFKGGAISVIAAPTSHGKTMALINFTLGALEEHPDKSVYFFTYEENKSAITTLFLNAYIGETLSKNNRKSIKHYFKNTGNDPFKFFFKNGKVPVSEGKDQPLHEYFLEKKDQFFKELIESGRLKIVYCDHDASKLFELIHGIHEKRDDLGLVCIDYMQLLNDSLDKGKRTSRQEELKSICLKMKNCAIDTGLPILISAQFNREVQSVEEMHATKISEAGDIERIANLLLGLWNLKFRPSVKGKNNTDFTPENVLYIEVLKGREIGVGHSVRFGYDGNLGKIYKEKIVESIISTPKEMQ